MKTLRKSAPVIAEVEIPRTPEAERAVIGAVLIDSRLLPRACELIGTEDFYSEPHRLIFASLMRLAETGAAIDVVTLKQDLADRGELVTVGGPAYIGSLIDGVPLSSNISHYAQMVAEKRKDRMALVAADGLVRALATRNGAHPGEGRESIRLAAQSLARALGDMDRPAAEPVDLAARLSEPERPSPAAIDGLVEFGAGSLGSGSPKSWKSTICAAAGLCVAAGKDFADRFRTVQAPFLHIDAELGERRCVELYRRLGRGEDLDVAQLARKGLFLYLNATHQGPAREAGAWTRIVRERGVGLVLLDPAVALFEGDENLATDVRRWWGVAVRPLLDEGAAVLIVHHSRKASPFVGDNASDAARGSGDWRGAPDLHFGLRCEPGDRRLVRLEVTGSRLGPEPAPFFLRVEDFNGGQRIRWAGEPEETLGKTVAAADAIEELVERAGDGGMPRQVILQALGQKYPTRTLEDALSLVRKRGDVEVRKTGKAAVYRRVRA